MPSGEDVGMERTKKSASCGMVDIPLDLNRLRNIFGLLIYDDKMHPELIL